MNKKRAQLGSSRGDDGTRTRDQGFADPCLTNLATSPGIKRAGDGIRTHDLLLGKETFYH